VGGSKVFLEKRVDQPNVFQYSKMRLGDGVPHKTAPKKRLITPTETIWFWWE
jgi:hypothetical protein